MAYHTHERGLSNTNGSYFIPSPPLTHPSVSAGSAPQDHQSLMQHSMAPSSWTLLTDVAQKQQHLTHQPPPPLTYSVSAPSSGMSLGQRSSAIYQQQANSMSPNGVYQPSIPSDYLPPVQRRNSSISSELDGSNMMGGMSPAGPSLSSFQLNAMQQQQQQAQQAPSPSKSTSSTSQANQAAARSVQSSKRAAQNRAAQRAFRQRKDKYIKDLESKAKELDEYKNLVESLKKDNKSLQDSLRTLRQELGKAKGMPVSTSEPTPTNHPLYHPHDTNLAPSLSTPPGIQSNTSESRNGGSPYNDITGHRKQSLDSLSSGSVSPPSIHNGLASPPHSTYRRYSNGVVPRHSVSTPSHYSNGNDDPTDLLDVKRASIGSYLPTAGLDRGMNSYYRTDARTNGANGYMNSGGGGGIHSPDANPRADANGNNAGNMGNMAANNAGRNELMMGSAVGFGEEDSDRIMDDLVLMLGSRNRPDIPHNLNENFWLPSQTQASS
ncbi:hypothetical protein BC938DRAFT_481392 [Jimgerdemannia flammicorona]|uniref:BZIP domain-containing protein n=1 Tax=Jimgerdemannia flammicorona TaxID=994334 RepID=A0A433QWU5_9FUNG|nr:hypothetical protein BC938DRAFT_481392 [Jimgerdemannia flammicorona]